MYLCESGAILRRLFGEAEVRFTSGRNGKTMESRRSTRSADTRFGLMNYGPLDLRTESAPQRVRLEIVGNPEGVEGIHKWVERIGSGVAAK